MKNKFGIDKTGIFFAVFQLTIRFENFNESIKILEKYYSVVVKNVMAANIFACALEGLADVLTAEKRF